MSLIWNLVCLVIALGALGGAFFSRQRSREGLLASERAALLQEKEMLQQQAKQEIQQMQMAVHAELQAKREELVRLEKRMERQEEQLGKQSEWLEKQSHLAETQSTQLQQQLAEINCRQTELTLQKQQNQQELEQLAHLSAEEARKCLFEKLEKQLAGDVSKKIREYQAYLHEQSERMAIKVLSQAIQRCAVDHVVESTVSVVTLPGEDMKGRIIGREGRNIRALEMATGVELLIDDTPEVVVISSFDPIRREIARRTLEKLIEDGRIHPTRIEELVEKVREELEQYMYQEGEAAALEVGVPGLHPEIVRLLGRLRYRSSYGQNILQHSKEVAYTAGIMAAEIGANIEIARRAGLLHDLGKALTYEEVGTHTALGIDFAKRYHESPKVLHAMAAHHFDVEPQTIEAVLVQVADTLSAARPGARSEPVERYIQRMRSLEAITMQFPGVNRAFILQAGREVRVIVEPDMVEEDAMPQLAHKIAEKIEQELEYPGQIKVSLIRETRASDFAR